MPVLMAAAILANHGALAADPVQSLMQTLGTATSVELRLLSPLKAYNSTFIELKPAEGRALGDSCIYESRDREDLADLVDILKTSVTQVEQTPTNFGGEFYWTLIFKKYGVRLNTLFVRAGIIHGEFTGVLDGGQFHAVPQLADRLEAWANRPNLILRRNVEAGLYPEYGKDPAVPDAHGRRPCTKWKG